MTSPLMIELAPKFFGGDHLVEVAIYDTAEEMLADALEDGFEDLEDSLALCHGYTDGMVPSVGIRYNREDLTLDIILHELIHAAQHIYRLEYLKLDSQVADHIWVGNEDFAHLFSELWAKLDAKLTDLKFYYGNEPEVAE